MKKKKQKKPTPIPCGYCNLPLIPTAQQLAGIKRGFNAYHSHCSEAGAQARQARNRANRRATAPQEKPKARKKPAPPPPQPPTFAPFGAHPNAIANYPV